MCICKICEFRPDFPSRTSVQTEIIAHFASDNVYIKVVRYLLISNRYEAFDGEFVALDRLIRIRLVMSNLNFFTFAAKADFPMPAQLWIYMINV